MGCHGMDSGCFFEADLHAFVDNDTVIWVIPNSQYILVLYELLWKHLSYFFPFPPEFPELAEACCCCCCLPFNPPILVASKRHKCRGLVTLGITVWPAALKICILTRPYVNGSCG